MFEIFAQQEYRSPGSSETGRKHMADSGLIKSVSRLTNQVIFYVNEITVLASPNFSHLAFVGWHSLA
jgi:hypothetical protein